MDHVSNVFNGFTNLMDQNVRGVQISCYSVALLGLTAAMRKVRPFSKFKSPSDIPNNFIKERRELIGLVKRIDPNGALLMVQHKPLVNIPLIPSGQLPVKISGVNVTGLGINWLQAIVVGSEVKCIPVLKKKDAVECEVLLLQNAKDVCVCLTTFQHTISCTLTNSDSSHVSIWTETDTYKKINELLPLKNKQNLVNLGENLVKFGFGLPKAIEKPLPGGPNLQRYYYRLQSAELYAIRKKLGLKYYLNPVKKEKKQKVINIGENLVKIGFGMTKNIEKPLADDPELLRYYKQLHSAELHAIRRELGLKYYIKPTKRALAALG